MSLRNLRRQEKKVFEGSLFLWGWEWKWGQAMGEGMGGMGRVRGRGLIWTRISYGGFGDFVLS